MRFLPAYLVCVVAFFWLSTFGFSQGSAGTKQAGGSNGSRVAAYFKTNQPVRSVLGETTDRVRGWGAKTKAAFRGRGSSGSAIVSTSTSSILESSVEVAAAESNLNASYGLFSLADDPPQVSILAIEPVEGQGDPGGECAIVPTPAVALAQSITARCRAGVYFSRSFTKSVLVKANKIPTTARRRCR